MKGFLRFVFNFFWVLLIGLWSAISCVCLGVACCVTVIGIPLGLQYFKFIKLVFAPAGKIVATKYTRHPVMNTIWLICGGFAAMVTYYVLGALCFITVIGAPIASQLFKIAAFNFAPFGAEVLRDGEYSKDRDLVYDYKLLMRRIAHDPQKVVWEYADGTKETALRCLLNREGSLIKAHQKIKDFEKKESFAVKVTVVVWLAIVLFGNQLWGSFALGWPVLEIGSMMIAMAIVMMVCETIKMDMVCALYKDVIADLMEHYPIGSPEAKKVHTFEQFLKALGMSLPAPVQNSRSRF